MGFFEILLVAVGLAMDAFAVSLGAGTAGYGRSGRATFRLAFHFGLFQFFMPIIGWSLGVGILSLIEEVDHWVAFVLLAFVGIRMIRSGFSNESSLKPVDPSRGWTLVMLCIATSIDALAVGLSLAVLRVSIWYPAAVIGLVTSGLSLIGVRLGSRLGARFGKHMEIIGGCVLVTIGARILISHLIG